MKDRKSAEDSAPAAPVSPEARAGLSRRDLLRDVPAGLLVLAGVAALAPRKAQAGEAGANGLTDRMRQDVARALAKPASARRWAMAIDLKKCIGCKACTVACVAENKTPPGMHYRPVQEEMSGSYPGPKRKYTPRPCMHCEKPACLEACPEKAIKRRDDGIVYIDYDLCKGAQACVSACPYDVPLFDEGKFHTEGTPAIQAYEKAASFEMGVKRTRSADAAPVNRARKCTYCFHRLDAGMLPACTSTCVGHATFFGDLNEPESLIAELAKSGRVQRLKESAGTKPTTFYLV